MFYTSGEIMTVLAINNGRCAGMPRKSLQSCRATSSRLPAGVLTSLVQPLEEVGDMIRNWLAAFYFYADDTLSSPGLSMLLARDFLAVSSQLDQLFTRHGVHRLNRR